MAEEKNGQELEPILAAILRRNVNLSVSGATQEAVSSALNRLQIVRLDREGITKLSNLEAISSAHSLYLQENQIKKIENVEVLKNLQFLSLSGNRIENISNLHCLRNLQFLDLSNNLIQKLNPGELPQNLLILDVSGNPCTKTNGYRQQVLQVLPHLQVLDGVTVRVSGDQKKSDTECEKEDSDSDDSSLLSEESGFRPDSLSSVAQDMLQRSLQRRERALKEHEDRLGELNGNGDGQSLLSSQDEVCRAELPGISHQNIDSQDKASSQTKKHNTNKSDKERQAASLLGKNTRDLYRAGKANTAII
ncbi:PREDICTED: leucine-rich repeat-containing protein 46 [Nanorana parkeri]|uniref:leucine-rich repeat-containing protein 46 n=1 Tax=Nanorana parkeri TaxID=125878 RepID=UPI000854D19D|nr:PREDICTED: leucine-rich repeat-containing protein 46 [Nanorana parkeri]